ncbi:putative UPF0481 protein At3g02645 [Prosopis cineraria]|uniref:putative UPF0481 protein At3g02645 n=1 Tax=Prosopis cineraria TaxID=364024 RepID=UPI002410262A|nr:putative UPF0481 protein At3g02645 [Prosopis cineraria]
MIVPRTNNDQQPDLVIHVDEFIESQGGKNDEESSTNSSYLKKFLGEVWKILSKLDTGPVRLMEKVLLSRPLKVFVKLPWTIISNLPGVKLMKQPIEHLFHFTQEEKAENEGSASNSLIEKPPLIEEIAIPSVTELTNSGVSFVPTNGSISSIKFDTKTLTFHLPKVGLDVNTEVLFRNLIAFEASVASGPLVLTRYTELMNGIVDGDEDAKVLRERGLILNHLKSDEEVADLWNGMSKSIKLTKVPLLDKVVEDVNKYYDGRLKVKAWKFMRSYIFGSWQFLTFCLQFVSCF